MKDKELHLEETEASHTLGGAVQELSNTLKYNNLGGVDIGVVALRGPMHLSVRAHYQIHLDTSISLV
jgi:hypothetical protein